MNNSIFLAWEMADLQDSFICVHLSKSISYFLYFVKFDDPLGFRKQLFWLE